MTSGPAAVIRAADVVDAGDIAAIYRPYVEKTVISFEDVAPDEAEVRARMLAGPRLPWLVATRDGAVVGYAYASRHHGRAAYRWSTDSSVYLAADESGRGTGRLLYASLFPMLRDLGYFRVFAGIALPNPASVALHESMGFVPVGIYRGVGFKFGGWHDVGWWQLSLRDDGDGRPPEPLAWSPG